MNDFELTYRLQDSEKNQLSEIFKGLETNPYKDFLGFTREVIAACDSSDFPSSFRGAIEDQKFNYTPTKPYCFIENCPEEINPPVLPYENYNTEIKAELKKYFISEAFLIMFSHVTKMPILRYKNVNGGDPISDLHPLKKLQNEQSQKALKDVFYHNDLANHYARPNFINIFCIRNSLKNKIYTTLTKNIDLVRALDPDVLAVLRQPLFFTPHDVLTTYGGSSIDLGKAPNHPIFVNDNYTKLFETRTKGITSEAEEALDIFIKLLYEKTLKAHLTPGTFFSLHNDLTIHARIVEKVTDKNELKNRWLIKTLSCYSMDQYYRFINDFSNPIIEG
ncbi:MAG: hypothetical protein JMN25_18285 [gamma proteobacterium endosymbiont of Lamellibrachia anaximandri]|nr:hypothetical protein [gamma proteobacterium endosymbiont of Lamellibrachia anaximandri]